jgi:hypothetical protein
LKAENGNSDIEELGNDEIGQTHVKNNQNYQAI